jgi:hypothetical protein
LQERGSVYDKDEKVVRVSFDVKGRVLSIEQWGL